MGVKQPNITFLQKGERIEYRQARKGERDGAERKRRRQGNKAWVCQHLSPVTPITLEAGQWAMGKWVLARQEERQVLEVRGEHSVLRGCTRLVWKEERTSAVGRESPHHPAAPCPVNSAVDAIMPSEHLSPVLCLVLSPLLPPCLDCKPLEMESVSVPGGGSGQVLCFSRPRVCSTRPRTQSGLSPKWLTPMVVRPAMAFPSQPLRLSQGPLGLGTQAAERRKEGQGDF